MSSGINVGKIKNKNHSIKPLTKPAKAPFLEAPFQYIPPKKIGANCAIATNAIKPIETSENKLLTVLK